MLISFNWLKQYATLPDSVTPEEVAKKLKLSTVEVDSIEQQGKNLENIVVGKIISCEKHPNADKLKVCKVDVGVRAENLQPVQIVCGGSNVAAGMLVAVAKSGARVKWHGEGDLVVLKPTVIRGVESNGMICASDEIGLAEMFPKKEEKEIADLSVIASPASGGINSAKQSPGLMGSELNGIATSARPSPPRNDKIKPGMTLTDALGLNDVIFEIDNKSLSNRPDLWGHHGMAREVAALFGKEFAPYPILEIKEGKELKLRVKVEDEKLCPKYLAVAIGGIKIQESPAWLKQALSAVGLRPINNIVDITNYVMLDLGQPMHAFDASRLSPKSKVQSLKSIVVRRAKEGEEFVTLDKKEHTLTNDMLVIATDDPPAGGKAVALAGVMGGRESGVTNDTTTIIFESANFDAAAIRRTSTKLGLRTDSSARFEKSLDPNMCELALARAVELLLELCPGAKVTSKTVGVGKPRLFTGPIEVPTAFFKQKLGIEIPAKTMISILTQLGFAVKEKKNILSVTIPTWRATRDISMAEDLVEEVARIYGYENIPGSLPEFPIVPPETNVLRRLEREIVQTLALELAYTEVYNYSFVSENQILKLGDDINKYIELDNPLSKEKPFLRRSLVPGLLENLKQNSADYGELRLAEAGKVFVKEESGPRAEKNGDELLPRQDTWLATVYLNKKAATPFVEARRAAEAVLRPWGKDVSFTPPAEPKPWQHPSRSADIICRGVALGSVYELHPLLQEGLGLEGKVGILEINLNRLADFYEGKKIVLSPLPVYPEVSRDIAFLVKKEATHAEIIVAIKNADPLIKKVELFDVFEGKNVGAGHKSMAYHITYADPSKTLTSAEIDAAHARVEKMLEKKFGAEVRK